MSDPVCEGSEHVENGAVQTGGSGNQQFRERRAKRGGKEPQFPVRTERLFLAIAQQTDEVIIIVDRQGEILYINKAGGRLAGKNALGKNAFVLLHSRSQEQFKQLLEESIATGKSAVFEHSGPESTWWLSRFIPVKEFGGPIPAAVITSADITRHRRMEEQLSGVNRALRVVGRCNEILVRSSDEGRFLKDACKAIVRTEGYNLVWVGLAEYDETKTVRPVAHAGFEAGYLETVNITWDDTERGKGHTGTAIRTGEPQVMRNIICDPHHARRRDEALKCGYCSSVALPMISEGRVIGALCVYSDQPDVFGPKEVELLMELASDLAYGIASLRNRSERDSLSQELINHKNKLRELGMKLALAEERERHRIASGIHDELSQKLVMFKFELQKLQHLAPEADICGSLTPLCERIDEMLEETRSLTFELSNPLLYTVGLSAAVKTWLEGQLRNKYDIHYELVSNLTSLCLDQEIRVTLFQALRELLTNVIKHAEAENVKVNMHKTNDDMRIVVEDDGIGFKAEEVLDPLRTSLKGGFGLFNLRERIEYLGGRFDIWSAPGKGTRVEINVNDRKNVGSAAQTGPMRTRS